MSVFTRERDNYTLYGALFGLIFPIGATCLEIWLEGIPFSVASVIDVQSSSPLQWIIDSAPLFLGIFARFGGLQLDAVNAKNVELQARNVELARLADEAQAATRAKSEFLSNMSHEIRTPMNAILGLSYLLLKSEHLNSEHRKHITSIQRSASLLLRIVNDILDHSKIEAGKLNIESSEFEVEPMIQTVIEQANVKLARKPDVELQVRLDERLPRKIVGDSLRIQQVIWNLLDNAIKFSHSGDIILSVSAKSTPSGCQLHVSVQDSGIGMSEQEVTRLFQPFTQADYSTTRKYGGTGLGLTICKNLVDLMGGEISVSSAPGQGTTFTFYVRVQRADDSGRMLSGFQEFHKRVLIIDDSPTSLEILQDMLHRFGFVVTTATSGEDAAILYHEAIVDERPFDLLLVDWRMPGMNGVEVVSMLRRSYPQHIPTIIMVTAYGREDVIEQARAVGIDGLLVKPVNPSLMYDTIVNLFDAHVLESSRDKARLVSDIDVDALQGLAVLLVEDNEVNQQVAFELLKMVRIRTEIANNGVEALEKLESGEYDLVLMDIQMPVMDGLTAAKEARRRGHTDLPIIAMTAHAMTGERERSMEAGMNDHLTKPVDPDELYRVIYEQCVRTRPDASERVARTVARPETVDPMITQLTNDVADFDLEGAINRCAGNGELLARLIRQFAQQQRQTLDMLESASGADELEILQSRIHNLKGVAANIGFMRVSSCASLLEIALTSSDVASIEENARELRSVLGRTLDAIAHADRPAGLESNGSGQVNTPELRATLERIMRMLAAGDPEATHALDAAIKTAPAHIASSLRDAYAAAVDWETDRARHILKNLHATL